MYLITWSSRYSIGIDEIDEHHRRLVSLLNTVYEDFIDEASCRERTNIFNDLADYTLYHFSAEETLMREHQYPDFETHKTRHDQFLQRLGEMQQSFDSGKRQLSFELLTFLNTWLLSHILDADGDFGRFLAIGKSQLVNLSHM